MEWVEASVSTNGPGAERVSEALMRAGAKGTQIIDRAEMLAFRGQPGYGELFGPELFEGLPEQAVVKAWFSSPRDVDSARRAVAALKADAGDGLGALTFGTALVRDEDWAENWKQYYKPVRVGERVVVKPGWEPFEPGPSDLVIEMDPGMAFGTGTHETTRLCLLLLQKHFQGGRALDVGTGTGILAIALAKLGAQSVLAVDIDPVAVRVAGENVARNGLAGRVGVREGDLARGVSGKFAFACANILADAVIHLALGLHPLLLPGGRFLASGIIKEREKDVLDACRKAGYALVDRETEGEWVALVMEKRHA